MTKKEFIAAIAEKAELNIKDVAKMYEAMTEVVATGMKTEEKIALTGFGTFVLKNRPARDGINPLTKEKIKIAASIKPVFRFAPNYKAQFVLAPKAAAKKK